MRRTPARLNAPDVHLAEKSAIQNQKPSRHRHRE